MFNKNLLKIIGFVAALAGFGASMLGDWVNEKKMDEKIEEKVNNAIAEANNEEPETEEDEPEEES